MPYMLTRFFLWCVINTLFRIKVEGAENIPSAGGGLLASNHLSYADSVLVGMPTRRIVRFIMWQPIYDAPVFNYFFRVLLAIPINESSPKGIIRAVRATRTELANGELVAIFPEGSISRDGKLGTFERGYVKMLEGHSAPIIPMFVDGVWGHPLSCCGGGVFKSWKKVWRPVVSVRIGKPIYERVPPEELREIILALGTGKPMSSLSAV